MGLAASNYRLLSLNLQQSSYEFKISSANFDKMDKVRESNAILDKYNTMLRQKNVVYYDNGNVHNIDYAYVMGNSNMLENINGGNRRKHDNSMILADSNGNVILSDSHARPIIQVLGHTVLDEFGNGGTFSFDKIPEIISAATSGIYTAEQIETVLKNGTVSNSFNVYSTSLLTGENIDTFTYDNSADYTEEIRKVVDFYAPIYMAAASNGWTVKYNTQISQDDSYISDMLGSGKFILAKVNTKNAPGQYEGTSLSYFVTSGEVMLKSDGNKREEFLAWKEQQLALIKEDEDEIDLKIRQYTTQQNAVKAEIESVKSYIKDWIQKSFSKD